MTGATEGASSPASVLAGDGLGRVAGLSGRRVVVTRPHDEAADLAAALRDRGALALMAPSIEIEAIESVEVAVSIRQAFAADDAVFVSPSAIRVFFALAARAHPQHVFAPRVFAIGPGSARLLAAQGVSCVLFPTWMHDSAGVLALPELAAPAARTIVIIGGLGGRTELADTLAARGAQVLRVSCYRRCAPAHTPLDHWLQGEAAAPAAASGGYVAGISPQLSEGPVDALVVTSTEGLHNLWAACGSQARAAWVRTPTFMPHSRIVEAARALGLREVILTESADVGIVGALERFFG